MRFLILLFLTLAGAVAVAADDTGPAVQTVAVLRVQNRLVHVFRVPAQGYAPRDRAVAAQARLDRAMEDDGPGEVTVRETPEGRLLVVDGDAVFLVAPGDEDRLAGETYEAVIDATRERLAAALKVTAETRSLRAWLVGIGLAALATILYVALVWAVLRVRRTISVRIALRVRAGMKRLHIAGVTVLDPSLFRQTIGRIVGAVVWVFVLVATYVWITFVLGRVAYTRPWADQLRGALIDTLSLIGQSVAGALPGLVLVGVIILVARGLVQVAGAFFSRVERGHFSLGWLDADTARPTRRLLTIVVWVFALAMAYPYLPGAHTDAFKGLSVLVGLMVSIGASGLVGQAASGLILMYSRAIRIGEFARIGDVEGTVTDLGTFVTRLRTGKGEEVVLPNALVMGQITRNYSRTSGGSGFTLSTSVTIGYDTPWRQVHAMLLEAAKRTRGLLAEPAPRVVQTALSDFYVEYLLIAQAGPEAPRQRAEALSELHGHVQDVFNEYDVQIMSPHYLGDPPKPVLVPPSRRYAPPARPPGDADP
jgi:small-conductance mechanosensitive channel